MSLKRILIAVPVIAVTAVSSLIVALWAEHARSSELPLPSGQFAVGRTMLHLIDSTSRDSLSPGISAPREWSVWVWYPASENGPTGDEYLPTPLRDAVTQARGPIISGLFTRKLANVRAHARTNAPIAEATRSYPVLVMRAGASAEVWNYSTLAEDAASHGFVVVGFDAPYRTNVVRFPDGRVIRRTRENDPELLQQRSDTRRTDMLLHGWSADIGVVLDRLAAMARSSGSLEEHFDFSRVGVFGHSFGGAVAAQFCHDDARCKAGIDIDGAPHGSVVLGGLRQPFMFLLSDHSGESDNATRAIKADLQSMSDHSAAGAITTLEIAGGNHFLFSDDGAVLKSGLVRWLLRRSGVIHIDGRRQLAVTAHGVNAFFARTLLGDTASIETSAFPELRRVSLLPARSDAAVGRTP